jgi:phosphatidylserine decarboxylase
MKTPVSLEHPSRGDSQPEVTAERASLPWRALLALLGRLPQAAISRALGRIADLRIPRHLRSPLLSLFSIIVGINRDEVELPLAEYPSINAFFVRRLRSGVRSWPVEPATPGSPVDGFCGQWGTIESGRIVQAKGRLYSCADLLDDHEEARRFEGGSFLTIYLSPRDYHRIHAPAAGSISRARHIPGELLPVNLPGVLEIPDLFPRNERIVCYLDTPQGRICVVAVGAINVGRISTAFDPAWSGSPWDSGTGQEKSAGWVTNRPGVQGATHSYDPPVAVSRGEEIMAFHLGSTVVLLFEPGGFTLRPDLSPGVVMRLGEPIGDARGN